MKTVKLTGAVGPNFGGAKLTLPDGTKLMARADHPEFVDENWAGQHMDEARSAVFGQALLVTGDA